MRLRTAAIVAVLVLIVGAGAYVFLERAMRTEAEKRVNEMVGRLAPFVDVAYNSVQVDVLRRRTSIRDLAVTSLDRSLRVRVDALEVVRFDDKNAVPHTLHVALAGIRVDTSSGSIASMLPDVLGYERPPVAAAEIGWAYDKGDLKIDPLVVRAADAGSIRARLHVGNVDFSDLARGVDTETPLLLALAAFGIRLQQILVYQAELEYQDDSLIARALKARALAQGKPLSAIRCEASTLLERGLDDMTGMLGAAPTVSAEARRAIRDGFDRPLKINWVLAPKHPVPLARIIRAKDDKEMAEVLNLKAQLGVGPTGKTFDVVREAAPDTPDPIPAERLERYAAVYSTPHVRHVRKALNAFLAGRRDGIWEDDDLLKALDAYRRFLDGPFVVLNVSDALMGGKEMVIAFQDRPVRLFHLWVYPQADDWELRMFSELEKSPAEASELLCAVRHLMRDRERAI